MLRAAGVVRPLVGMVARATLTRPRPALECLVAKMSSLSLLKPEIRTTGECQKGAGGEGRSSPLTT
jgi:hypothetical protein